MGDGTGCDNMTAIIVQFKPKYFEVMTSIPGVQATDAQITEQEVLSRKRLPEEEADLTEETECKRQKVEDDDQDMTPSTVDTSTA